MKKHQSIINKIIRYLDERDEGDVPDASGDLVLLIRGNKVQKQEHRILPSSSFVDHQIPIRELISIQDRL